LQDSLEQAKIVLCTLVVSLVKNKTLSVEDAVLLFPQG
jgi:hypothetical protein